MQASRPEHEVCNVASLVEQFYTQVEITGSNPKDFLIEFLTDRSFACIYAVNAAYVAQHGRTLQEVILKHTFTGISVSFLLELGAH